MLPDLASAGGDEQGRRSPAVTVAHTLLAAFWLLVVWRLTIVDVWDETTGLRLFRDPSRSFLDLVGLTLTESIGFWRPIPATFAAIVMRAAPGAGSAWVLLRLANVLILGGALVLMHGTIRRWSRPGDYASPLVTAAFLFSGSAVIAGSWGANIFDIWSLLFVLGGLYAMTHERFRTAGVIFGAGFFCKETTALILPFLVLLVSTGRLRWREALRSAIPAAGLGVVYFLLRSRLIDFGSATDTHQFRFAQLWPTVVGFAESFWFQNLKRSGPGVMGVVCFAIPFVVARDWKARSALMAFFASCVVIYWGMLAPYQDGVLLSALNFVGRLYLVPFALVLLYLAVERQWAVTALLLVPLAFGAWQTARDHDRFQRAYENVYRVVALERGRPVMIDSPPNPQVDAARGFIIGDQPDAPWVLDVRTGEMRRRSP